MEVMGKIAAAAVTAALFGTVVRRGSPELALLLTVTAGVWILTAVLDGLGAAAAMAERLAQLAQMDAAVAGPVLKTVVVALVTRITAEICRGAGEGGLAAFVETAGTILALTVALPLMAAVLTMLEELLW